MEVVESAPNIDDRHLWQEGFLTNWWVSIPVNLTVLGTMVDKGDHLLRHPVAELSITLLINGDPTSVPKANSGFQFLVQPKGDTALVKYEDVGK